MRPIPGSCLCGEVSYEFNPDIIKFKYCFCPRCQKVTGSGHAANIFVKPYNLKWIKGESNIKRFDLPDAKSFATAFCRTCGSPVPHLTRNGSEYVIPAGSLDEDPGVKPQGVIYRDHQAYWYIDPDQLPRE
jgi:hypothetical protein